MAKVNLKINNIPVQAEAGTTILEAARAAGIKIPTLCYLKDINAIGACRVCVCEVKGARSLVAACVYPVSEGMEVFTNTKKVMRTHPLRPRSGLPLLRPQQQLRAPAPGSRARLRRT